MIPATLVAGLCVGVVLLSPPTYRATGSLVLLNPPSPPQTQIGGPEIPEDWQNPYVRMGDLSVLVDLMVQVMDSDQVAKNLDAAGFDSTAEICRKSRFLFGPDRRSRCGSLIRATSNLRRRTSCDTVFNEQLEQLQLSTVEKYRIRAETVAVPTMATTVFSSTLRLLIVAVGFGGILVIGVAIFFDRRSSRSSTTSSDGDSDDDSHDDSGAELGDPLIPPGKPKRPSSRRRKKSLKTQVAPSVDEGVVSGDTEPSPSGEVAAVTDPAGDEGTNLAAAGDGRTQLRPPSRR